MMSVQSHPTQAQHLKVSLLHLCLLFIFSLFLKALTKRPHTFQKVQQWWTMDPCSLGIACLCWLQPQGHLAHFLVCCEEVREAWRHKRGGEVRGFSKLPLVVVASAGQTAAEDQRGSVTRSVFVWRGEIQHILFCINKRATTFDCC